MKKIRDIINSLLNVCDQMGVGALLTCRSGIICVKVFFNKSFICPLATLERIGIFLSPHFEKKK